MVYCHQCLEKQQRINELEEEIACLKMKLRSQERTAKEGFFGSSTPSAKLPVKPNSPAKHQHNQGGGKAGHKGHGRSSIYEQQKEALELLPKAMADGRTKESRDSRPVDEEQLHRKIGQQAIEIDFLKKKLRQLGLLNE